MSAASAAILGCLGTELTAREAAFFREAAPWGFILFARNVDNPGQLRRLTGALRDTVGRDAPIFVDQEGGREQRLRPPYWRDWPAPLDQAEAAGPQAARAMELRYRIIASELREAGIDGNCIPTADIAGPDTHPFLLNRCLGRDAGTVIEAARGAARGSLAGGVLPVVKHIPGHGRATADSHLELPRVTASPAELAATDFAVFRALADLPLGMTAHVVYTGIDPDRPATLSPVAVGAIRREMGFGGLLMTDDLSMKALDGRLSDLTRAALAAGCDIALHCNGEEAEMAEVVAAAGALSPEATARAEAALGWRQAPDAADIPALEAELAALAGGGHG
ncbi:MAG: glycoside hydrolase family 3 N-terminal domain-containing protein [Gemmobacter sp.]